MEACNTFPRFAKIAVGEDIEKLFKAFEIIPKVISCILDYLCNDKIEDKNLEDLRLYLETKKTNGVSNVARYHSEKNKKNNKQNVGNEDNNQNPSNINKNNPNSHGDADEFGELPPEYVTINFNNDEEIYSYNKQCDALNKLSTEDGRGSESNLNTSNMVKDNHNSSQFKIPLIPPMPTTSNSQNNRLSEESVTPPFGQKRTNDKMSQDGSESATSKTKYDEKSSKFGKYRQWTEGKERM